MVFASNPRPLQICTVEGIDKECKRKYIIDFALSMLSCRIIKNEYWNDLFLAVFILAPD
jgi:hypothetical protein